MKLPLNVVQFAGAKTDVYEGFKDYYFHYMSENAGKSLGSYDSTISLDTKETTMNAHLFSEIQRVSGQTKPDGIDLASWAMNPTLKWATFAVVNMLIDSIIPDTIIKSIGIYTDIKTVPYGGVAQFDVKPNSLFTVSKGSNAQRTTFVQKQFDKSVSVVAVNHAITVEVSLYKVLCGEVSLADFVRKAVLSIERDMSAEAYDALNALVDGGSFPTQLTTTGFTTTKLLNFCEVVTAYNQGNKAVIVGTSQALANILPDQALGYRITTNSENMGIQLIRNFYDYDIVILPQVATGSSYGLKLKNDRVYIISTSSDKIIKGVIEGATTTNTDGTYDNADLTQHSTLNKRYAFSAVTNSTMGMLKFS